MSAVRAAAETGLPERSVQIWAKRLREISPKEVPQTIRDEDLKIIGRSQELIHDAYDEIEEAGEAKKYLIPINAIKGTAQDKDHRASASRPSGTVIINFNIQPMDEVTEGEVRESEQPDTAIEAEFTETD